LHHDDPPTDLPQVRNEINVTPLVDVCLVLLIIFMVIAPMLSRGKEVPLPQTKHHAQDKDSQQPIVALDQDRNTLIVKYFIDKEEIPVTNKNFKPLLDKVELAWKKLEQQQNTDGIGRVFLKVHKDVKYEKVYPVLIALHDLGASVDLGTNEIKEKGGSAGGEE
jgi:biopolymer transport protein ExbD